MNHTEVLNCLIKKCNLKYYLEIGVQNPENNYDKVTCKYKKGIDPSPKEDRPGVLKLTSDEYFNEFSDKYDLIFIDGLHEYEQVKRDFLHSLQCLNDGGFIVLHDTNPSTEEMTLIPRVTKEWTGDVYRFACELSDNEEIDFITLEEDYGITVAWKAKSDNKLATPVITWEFFKENKRLLLNIIAEDKFKELIESTVTAQS